MSRFDSIGMFWQDVPTKRGRGDVVRIRAPIPDTGWIPPQYFPDLTSATAIGIDCETWDPDLDDFGPGWARGRGHICGVSVAVPGGHGWYFPVRHEVEPEYNLDPVHVFGWLREMLKGRCPKIGANLLYDIGWLTTEGIEVNGPLYDIQFAEALLDSEAPNVSLEALSQNYLGMGKETSLLYEWCAQSYGGNATGAQRKHIYQSPPRLAGPYAESDAKLPLQILEKQWPLLERRGVMDLFSLECRLIPLLVKMRNKGTPINVANAEEAYGRLNEECAGLSAQMKALVGKEVNPHATASIRSAFESLGIPAPKTKAGKDTFAAPALASIDHPFIDMMSEYKQRVKLRDVFIKSYIIDSHVNGRIYCEFHPLKSDDSGARSGRFSSSSPNLQNIPTRTEMGKIIRKMFIAQLRWRKYDYSQIEYRLLAHYAVGEGADEIRQAYLRNPKTDYHKFTQNLIHEKTGILLERGSTKTINFGLIYGMGKQELIKRLGLGSQQGNNLYKTYHKAVPFAKATADQCSTIAQQEGHITTILNRHSDFNLWGPQGYDKEAKGLPIDEAIAAYGGVQRLYTHKALNRRLQGSNADIMKKAMVQCYEDGIFDDIGIPLLTVHDELDFDDDGTGSDGGWDELKYVMENCVKIRVPIMVELQSGPTWGECA